MRASSVSASPVGALLKHWREVRQMSQLDLALSADVSPRHVSFVETGRAQPSRDMVLGLANALKVPLREQNSFLLAAGFAPIFRETALDAVELGAVRTALDAILRQQEPFPAVVMSRHWDLLEANEAAGKFFGFLLGSASSGPANVIRLLFDPNGLRPYVTNWERVAPLLIERVHREAVGGVADAKTRALLEEVFQSPGVPVRWRHLDPETPLLPVLPVSFAKAGKTFDFFSTVTTLGTPQDVTLQEIRIECFFPLNALTERNCRDLGERKE